jgi:ketosteroid isomerase-like protein
MSDQTVQVVRAVTDAFARGDLETVFAAVAPEIEWDFTHTDQWPEQKIYRGYESVLEFFRAWTEEWDDYRFEVEEIIDAGDQAVAVVHDEGRGRRSGIPLERRHAELWTVEDGKVIRIELFDDKADALEAAG